MTQNSTPATVHMCHTCGTRPVSTAGTRCPTCEAFRKLYAPTR